MLWSFDIGRIAGTAIRVHITFVLFLGLDRDLELGVRRSRCRVDSLAFMILLFACVLAHEFGHIFVARHFGVATPTVTLLPIGGVAQLERIPEKPSEEFLVAIAGPLVNVVIAVVLVVVVRRLARRGQPCRRRQVRREHDRPARGREPVSGRVQSHPGVSDGWRTGAARRCWRAGSAMSAPPRSRHRSGRCVAFGLGFLGLFGNPLLIFIAIFVYLAASSEAQLVAIRAMSRDVPVAAAMMTQIALPCAGGAYRRGGRHADAHQPERISRGGCTGALVGVLSRADLIRALKQLGPDARIADAMTKDIPTVGHRACLEEAIRLLQEKRAPAVGVVDAGGKLAGLITSETIGEMLMVREALPAGGARRPMEPAGGRVTAAGRWLRKHAPTCSPSIATREFMFCPPNDAMVVISAL